MPKWLFILITFLWPRISKPLREAIVKSVAEWEQKAKATENQLDDIAVGLLKWLLGIE